MKPAGSCLVSSSWFKKMLKPPSYTLVEQGFSTSSGRWSQNTHKSSGAHWSSLSSTRESIQISSTLDPDHMFEKPWAKPHKRQLYKKDWIFQPDRNQHNMSQTGFFGWTEFVWKYASIFSEQSFIKCKPHPPGIQTRQNQALWSRRFLLEFVSACESLHRCIA